MKLSLYCASLIFVESVIAAESVFLCRCPASWEKFYRRQRNLVKGYPFNYEDVTTFEGYYVVEGVLVLPSSDKKCDKKEQIRNDSLFFRNVNLGNRKLRSRVTTPNEEHHRALASSELTVFTCPTAISSAMSPVTSPTEQAPKTPSPTRAPTAPTGPSPVASPVAPPVPSPVAPPVPPTSAPTDVSPTPSIVPTLALATEQPRVSELGTQAPSSKPTHGPTTLKPSSAPTTVKPTYAPTPAPTTVKPTFAPTPAPTTVKPTFAPTPAPTTVKPTFAPTPAPTTVKPTFAPTPAPTTVKPTFAPTTLKPSPLPSIAPTGIPGSFKLYASYSGAAGEKTGEGIAYSKDEKFLVVGSPQADNGKGRVQIFHTELGGYTQVGSALLGVSNGDNFGRSVDISEDGVYVVIGAPHAYFGGGEVSIYRKSATDADWTQVGNTIRGPFMDNLGYAVASSGDGMTVIVGAPGMDIEKPGFAEVYGYKTEFSDWVRIGVRIDGLNDGDLTGYSVDISDDGTIAAVGAPGADLMDTGFGRKLEETYDAGRVSVYWLQNSNWVELEDTIYGDIGLARAGTVVSLSSTGHLVAFSMPGLQVGDANSAGVVRVVTYFSSSNKWYQVGSDIEGRLAGAEIGRALAFNSDGDALGFYSGPMVDSSGQQLGATFSLRSWNGYDWVQWGPNLELSDASNTYFHIGLSGNGDSLLVGYDKTNASGTAASYSIVGATGRPVDYPVVNETMQNENLTCIAVVDSNNDTSTDASWSALSREYPGRTFCLLQPTPPAEGKLYVPSGFLSGNNSILGTVPLDNGDSSLSSDWFNLCNLDESLDNGINRVSFFVHSSNGNANSVSASLALLDDKLKFYGFKVFSGTYNNDGDYFNPCRTTNVLVTASPTARPSGKPTTRPFSAPTPAPSPSPTYKPSPSPTARPTPGPTRSPTAPPTQKPSPKPTSSPTRSPPKSTPSPTISTGFKAIATVSGTSADDMAGKSISYTSDGKLLAVGFPGENGGSGVTRVYSMTSSGWQQYGGNVVGNSGEGFGSTVVLAGNMLFVGAPQFNDGLYLHGGRLAAYKFSSSSAWERFGDEVSGTEHFANTGYSIAASNDGNIFAVGSPVERFTEVGGYVQAFWNNGTNWSSLGQKVQPDGGINGLCGNSIAMSGSGKVLAVSCPAMNDSAGRVIVYKYDEGSQSWGQFGGYIDGGQAGASAGISIAIDDAGVTIAIGSPGSSSGDVAGRGAVRILTYSSGTNSWQALGSDIVGGGENYGVGQSVSLSDNGRFVGYYAGPVVEGGSVVGGTIAVSSFVGSQWVSVGPSLKINQVSSYYTVALDGTGSSFVAGFGGSGQAGKVEAYRVSTPTPAPTPAPVFAATGTSSPSRPIVQNQGVTCISVIDENGGANVDSVWQQFDATYPDRPFCLLQPVPIANGTSLYVPSSFYSDAKNVFSTVNRGEQDPQATSDWYSVCKLSESKARGIHKVILYFDRSVNSNEEFLYSMYQFNLQTKMNGFEIVNPGSTSDTDYISPCIATSV